MTISAKIQIGTGGIANYNEWELVYNASTQPVYKTYVGLEVGQPEDTPVWHQPSGSAAVPVQFTPENKQLRLTMDVLGDDWDAIIGSIAALKRALKQAPRATIGSGEEKVRVALKPSGATYTTYYTILSGTVDDSQAYYTAEAVTSGLARQVVVLLTVEPFGYGDSFTLSNQLASSPHFVEDSNADGLADGWTKTGTPTTSINTTQYLMGGKSQAISTSTQFHGIYSSSISLTDGQSGAGYVWLTVGTAGWVIQIYNVTDASVTVTKTITATDSNAVSDRSTKNSAGGTAWRVPLTWTNSTGGTKSYRIYIIAAASVSSNCIVHMAYLGEAASVPPAFSSKRNLYNRMDPGIATTNIPYLDIWGVPGDAPAQVDILAEPSAGKMTQVIVGAYADGIDLATAVDFYHDSSEFSTPSGTWSTGTGTINNDYKQCSTTTGALVVAGSSEIQKISNLYTRQPWRVFVRAYTSDTAATIQMKYYSANSVSGGGVLVAQTAVGQLTETSKWQMVDLGTLNLLDVLSNDVLFALSEEIHITQASSQTLRIDGVYYMPTATGFNISKHYDLSGATKNFLYDASTNQSYDNNTAIRLESLGDVPYLMPGNVMNRIVFIALDGTDNEHDITTVFPVTLTVTPRTSHLLGVS